MKSLSGDELVGINQQAATAAASVLSESVVAATLCQSKIPFEAKAFGRRRWFGKGVTDTQAIENRISKAEDWLASGGLPDSFILAVTASSIHAIEDKRHGEQLIPGTVLKSWVRSGFRASVDPRPFAPVPADCQVLKLCLPIEAVKNRAISRQLEKAAEMLAARGLPPVAEHAFVVARDASTQGVIDALTKSGPGVRATAAADAGAPPQSSVAQRLQELESLRGTGVISDAEYTAKREQIINDI